MTYKHDQNFWSNKYQTHQTGWDIGGISAPLKAYFDQLTDKSIRILIPGAGRAWEAEYLHRMGFKNVFVVDLAPEAIEAFSCRVPDFPKNHLLCKDFFDLNGKWDLIIEQTFFCALHPTEREQYSLQMQNLLVPGGKLAGLLFTEPLNNTRPPYGGSQVEYRQLFSRNFEIKTMEIARNSIQPRAGRELFMVMVRK